MKSLEENELLTLLKKYEKKSKNVIAVMLEDFKVDNKKDFIRKKSLYVSGELPIDSKYKYLFHGRGCRVIDYDNNPIIDWDFGYDDKWFGINIMLFLDYLEIYAEERSEDLSYSEVQIKLEKLVDNDIIYKKAGLYYLT